MFFHATSAAIFAYGFLALDGLPINTALTSRYGGHWQYLTMQGLALAWLTMIMGALLPLLPRNGTFNAIKRRLLMLSLPLTIAISLIYWSLALFLPHLIFPITETAGTDAKFYELPLNIDLALHLAPAVSLFVDFYLWESKYEQRHVIRESVVTILLYGASYIGWVEHCAQRNGGVFPYPFLTEASILGRVYIYIGAAMISCLSFHFLNYCHP